MTKSMTAYGRAEAIEGGKKITVEIKSVNSRYLDCSVRVPRYYDYLEERVKAYIHKKGIFRGKVDVGIYFERIGSEDRDILLDEVYAEEYINALRVLRDKFGLKDDITVTSVAANTDIFIVRKAELDIEEDWQQVIPVLDAAIGSFDEMRLREGSNLRADVLDKRDKIYVLKEKIAELSDSAIANYRSRLETRLNNVLAEHNIELDSARILTECAIFADRIAIDEELVRLGSHLGSLEGILSAQEPSGRKLDFLVQEINRESNTIGSKCNDAEIAGYVVELKSEIEKIREQIQNIE